MNDKLVSIGKKLKFIGKTNLLKIQKYSPEILTGVGIVGVIGATVLACKATLKAESVIDGHNFKINAIHEAKEIAKDDSEYIYTDQDALSDTVTTYAQTGFEFLKLYWPAITVGAGAIVCLLSAHNIMKQRNVALVAAYEVIEKSFNSYRDRVIKELGKEKDFHFMYDTAYENITVEETDENGKKKKVKKQIQVVNNLADGTSMYARLFDAQVFAPDGELISGSTQWTPQPEYNAHIVVYKNQWANEHLRANGFLFLNEVYDELGFPRTKAGQVVGWYWQGNGDNYVSFGPEVDAIINKTGGYTSYREGAPILLDFNVDGVILDMIP